MRHSNASKRRNQRDGDSFGMPLADLLTTALGCVLLIFMIASTHLQDLILNEKTEKASIEKDLLTSEERARLLEEAKERVRLEMIELQKRLQAQNQALSKLQGNNALLLQEIDQAKKALKDNRSSFTQFRSQVNDVWQSLNPKLAQPVDVMLVIDGTRSMKPSLDATRSQLRAIIGALHVVSPSARVGITVFRDRYERKKLRLEFQPLTDNPDDLEDFLDQIKATSTRRDKDRPEWLCGGLERGMKSEWREKSIKIITLVSDASAQSPKAKKCIELAKQFKKQNGLIHVSSTLPDGYQHRKEITREYDEDVLVQHRRIALAGGGKHIEKARSGDLLQEVLRSAFQSRLNRTLELIKPLQENSQK